MFYIALQCVKPKSVHAIISLSLYFTVCNLNLVDLQLHFARCFMDSEVLLHVSFFSKASATEFTLIRSLSCV